MTTEPAQLPAMRVARPTGVVEIKVISCGAEVIDAVVPGQDNLARRLLRGVCACAPPTQMKR